jgi:hypothetical protein
MQPIKKRIDMYQVAVPAQTVHRLGRSRSTELGPVYCRECGKFFSWKAHNICDLDKCSRHTKKKLIGFRLIDSIE